MSGTPGPAVQPLRIHKHTSSQDFETNSPVTSPIQSTSSSRPLSDAVGGSTVNSRRNSIQYAARRFGEDMAQFGSSPALGRGGSPRAFWLGNLQENTKVKDSPAPSPRRSSLENLKKASRVQNNKLLKSQLTPGASPSPAPAPPSSRPMSMPPQPFGSSLRLDNTPGKLGLRTTTNTPIKKPESPSPTGPGKITTPPKNATLTSIMRGEGIPNRMSPKSSSRLSSYKVNGRSDVEETPEQDDTFQTTQHSPNRRKAVTFSEPQVLTYELVTPVPSVGGSPRMSYDSHGSDDEDEDDEEDDDYDYTNTPVIEPPDHWRDTPDRVATPPRLGDPFRASPSPTGRPLPPLPGTPVSRSDSNASNRPLPNIPFRTQVQSQQQYTLHEKMQLMMQKTDDEHHPDPNEHHPAGPLGISFEELIVKSEIDDYEGSDSEDGDPQKETSLEYDTSSETSNNMAQFDEEFEFKRPKKISRDSIRRHVNEQRDDEAQPSNTLATIAEDTRATPEPAPTAESVDGPSSPAMARPTSRFTTRYPDDEPETTASECSETSYTETETESEAGYTETEGEDSDATPTADTPRAHSPAPASPEQVVTILPNPVETSAQLSIPMSPPTPPKDEDEEAQETTKSINVSLPDFISDFGADSLGLRDFMTPSPPPVAVAALETKPMTPQRTPEPRTPSVTTPPMLSPSGMSAREYLERPSTPEGQGIELDEDLEKTPESVIRHKIYRSDEDSEFDDEDDYEDAETEEEHIEGEDAEFEEVPRVETPVLPKARTPSPIPEDAATIRAPGGKLRTRPSATPADMAAMAAQRRQVSGDHSKRPPLRGANDSDSSDAETTEDEDEDHDDADENDENTGDVQTERTPSKKASRKSLKMPTLDELNIEFSMDDIGEEFDRVIETQKRGYLMRHSTRVIHASSRDIDEEPATRPGGHKRTQSWQVEPWKGSGRRKSQRASFGTTKPENVPPMPGQTEALPRAQPITPPAVASSSPIEEKKPPTPENGERGRLFVKVIGVKELTLPMPQREPTWFCLTLDNGLHCVTTSWLELGKNAPIGQEFELVVLNDLEFQLTLQTKLEKPPPKPAVVQPAPPPQPVKTPVKPKSTFSRVFTTAKKRKELERQQQQQQQQLLQQQQAQAQAQAQKPEEPLSAWELLNGLVARDGSFARSYVCLKDFEQRAYGRPFTTEINCFNEWAIEPNSLKTKRGLNPAKRPPYKIGKLEVQMLFVPKPPGMTDKDLPKSMAAAIRELKEAESMVARSWEGYLSQQGGDCPYWRRRYFKLVGAKLTAYHEVSRQPRATINLSKATRLIDDRPSLTEPEVPASHGKRRKSAFSEMEEGYMFVEEGFRIKFANGETIDFYADNAEDKKGWMQVLGETIGGGQENRSWCEVILNKEKQDREAAANGQQRRMQQQQTQHQSFEKSYLQSPASPPPPQKTNKRPVSGIMSYPNSSHGSHNSLGR